jgi:hypothetical protein
MFFEGITTLEEATARYHALARRHHPDVSDHADAGDVMARINAEYKDFIASWSATQEQDNAEQATVADDRPERDVDSLKAKRVRQVVPPAKKRPKAQKKAKRPKVDMPPADVNRLWEKAQDLVTDLVTTGIREGIKKLRRSG